jgi:hypothetical protein
LQLLAQSWQIDDIHLEDRFVVLRYRNRESIERLASRSGKRLRIVDARSAYFVYQNEDEAATDPIAALKVLLQQSRLSL